LRAAIATRRGSCWWDVDHAGWVVTLNSSERQEFYGRTLEEGLAWCLVWLMAPELGIGPFLVCRHEERSHSDLSPRHDQFLTLIDSVRSVSLHCERRSRGGMGPAHKGGNEMGVRFGATVRNSRVRKGVSLRRLGRDLDFSPAHISDIERGNRNPPSPAKVRRWAEVIGEDPERLVELAAIDRPSVELVNNGSPGKSELANFLARGWQDMTPEQEQNLMEQAKKILGG
jgi:transcriptional regulator with XRE-family HTH domain